MLRWLRIQDVVLVQQAELEFGPGLNCLTGETGAGKSAITRALGLLLGQRAESDLIRQGCQVGLVEAEFSPSEEVERVLQSGGVRFEPGEPLLIRRELYAHGRHRAYVNSQPAHVSLIRLLGPYLVEFVGQSANHLLRDCSYHLRLLDQYAGVDLSSFQEGLKGLRHAEQSLLEWQVQEAESSRLAKQYSQELEELEELDLKEGEEETLFEEFSALSTAEERRAGLQQLESLLIDGSPAVVPLLQAGIETVPEEFKEVYRSALLDLEEVGRSVSVMISGVESSPERLSFVQSRLSEIDRLKRRFGDLFAYREKIATALSEFEKRVEKEEELKAVIEGQKALVQEKAQQISRLRKDGAKHLCSRLTDKIRELNMPSAIFEIALTPVARTLQGDERVEFMLQPNEGERPLSVADQVSGGELARVMLALKSLLVGGVGLLLFDEVDANIGGKTADLIGQRLKEIGGEQQVLCITHFPQVAQYADTHFAIAKSTIDGRTITAVQPLDGEEKREELLRMQGSELEV